MISKLRLAVLSTIVATVALVSFPTHQVGRAQEPSPGGMQIVLLVLEDQEQVAVARAVRAEAGPRVRALAQTLQAAAGVLEAASERPLLASRDEEAAYREQVVARGPASAEMEALRAQAARALDAAQRQMTLEILARSAASRWESQRSVTAAVEALGGRVLYAYSTLNAIAAAIPPAAYQPLADHPQVATILNDEQLRSHMNVSPYAIGADAWWPQHSGGIWDVAIIDSGIDVTHPALSSQYTIQQRCLASADYFDPSMPANDPSLDDVNGHGTHIAGTVASADASYRGIAYGLDTLLNGKAGFDLDGSDGGYASMYWSDAMACVDWALTNGVDDADVINLSYGSEAFEDDGPYERFWDAVVDQTLTVVTISAGNDGPAGYTLNSPGTAYNVISVANVDDRNSVSRGDDVISSSSSRGPTPGGRRKPDLAAPGSDITSTNNNWESSSDFVRYWGTSMAAPHVAAAAALMMDRGVFSPMAIKALLINTAQDRGDAGWDAAYGWGYVDMGHLDFHVPDFFEQSIGPRPAFRLVAGPAVSGDTATLVWHRRAVYERDQFPSTYYTLTDLDLIAFDEATNDYLGSSLSSIDNVEQVGFAGSYGTVVLKVDAWSTSILGTDAEDYALATEEGFTLRDGPAIRLNMVTAGDIEGPAGTVLTVTASVRNDGDLKAHDINLTAEATAGLQLQSGGSHFISGLDVGASTPDYTWTFLKLNDDPQMIRLRAISHSYEEEFSGWAQWGGARVYLPLVSRSP